MPAGRLAPQLQLRCSCNAFWVCRYNLRVVECRLAAMLLAVALGKPASEAVRISTLKEVEPLIIDKFGPGTEAQDKAVREHLKEGVYMPEEVCTTAQLAGLQAHIVMCNKAGFTVAALQTCVKGRLLPGQVMLLADRTVHSLLLGFACWY